MAIVDDQLEPQETSRARRLKDAALEARTLLRDRAGDVAEHGRRYADVAGRQLSAAQRRAVETVREKPVTTATVVLVGAAFLAGLYIALRQPETVRRLADRVRDRF
jgi:cytochrome c-type biogenesis protein CcmH/NrfG